MSKNVIGAILIVGAVVLGFFGYGASQPTMGESMAAGFGGAIASLQSDPKMQRDVDNIKSAQFQRGLPYYIIGFLAGVAGIVVIVRNKQAV
jgi:hypothetical protein